MKPVSSEIEHERNCSVFGLHQIVFLLLQLLIGFECGIVVLWDLKSKKADYRYNYDEVRHCLHILLQNLVQLKCAADRHNAHVYPDWLPNATYTPNA